MIESVAYSKGYKSGFAWLAGQHDSPDYMACPYRDGPNGTRAATQWWNGFHAGARKAKPIHAAKIAELESVI